MNYQEALRALEAMVNPSADDIRRLVAQIDASSAPGTKGKILYSGGFVTVKEGI